MKFTNRDESILNYLDRIRVISLQGEIAEEVLVTMALLGLPEHWETRINAARIPGRRLSWDELYRICWIHWNVPATRVDEQNTHVETVAGVNGKDWGKRKPTNKKYQGKERKRKSCHFHQAEGHWTSECKELERLRNMKTAHAVEAGVKAKDGNLIKETFSYSASPITEAVFLVPAILRNGRVAKFLVETGSDVNLVQKKGSRGCFPLG